MVLFDIAANLGRDLAKFVKKSKWRALGVILLSLIFPFNLIFIVVLVSYLHRGK